MNTIDISVKKHCVELNKQGLTSREIYEQYFSKIHEGQSFEAFRVSLGRWKKKAFADDDTLAAGTYPNFIPRNATVQVNGSGDIVQAWIKQSLEESWLDELIEVIKTNVTPITIESKKWNDSGGMLEIPLFDQHFPLNNHKETLSELLGIIEKQHWEEINIIVGQDLFHNDDFRGRTTSGRQIEKVNIVDAWEMAKAFYIMTIRTALLQSNHVNVIYSKGNHDESLAWAFVEMLKELFPAADFDDSLKPRKCIYWNGCFIGITHGNATKSLNNDFRGQFTIEFSQEFSNSKVREIHSGHLHHEKECDLYGVMIRRLSTGATTDEWSENEGFVGSHKRFMIFEWNPNRLKAIYYI